MSEKRTKLGQVPTNLMTQLNPTRRVEGSGARSGSASIEHQQASHLPQKFQYQQQPAQQSHPIMVTRRAQTANIFESATSTSQPPPATHIPIEIERKPAPTVMTMRPSITNDESASFNRKGSFESVVRSQAVSSKSMSRILFISIKRVCFNLAKK